MTHAPMGRAGRFAARTQGALVSGGYGRNRGRGRGAGSVFRRPVLIVNRVLSRHVSFGPITLQIAAGAAGGDGSVLVVVEVPTERESMLANHSMARTV